MKKIKDTKKTSAVIMGAGIVALSGVAMAAWIITGVKGPVTTANITVTVGDVVDKRLGIENPEVGDSSIMLDAKSSDSTLPIVHTGGGGEDLSFTISYDVTGALDSNGTNGLSEYFGGVKSFITIVTDDASESSSSINAAGEALESAIAASQVVLPVTTSPASGGENVFTASSITASVATTSAESNPTQTVGNVTSKFYANGTSLHVISTYSFAWGTAFDWDSDNTGENPGEYTGTDSSSIESILSALESLKAASGAHINVTLTPFTK